jgi:hypothetical protein
MKIAVAVPAGLVVGLVLGTLGGKMLHPPAPPAAEASADSGGTVETPPPAEAAVVDTGSPGAPPEAAAVTPTMTPTPIDAAPTPAPGAAEVQRLAKILDRLAAADALALVTGWSDQELEAVLRVMDVTKAADLVAALPKARAATMSKRLLSPAGTP